jgi:hypothetical protein
MTGAIIVTTSAAIVVYIMTGAIISTMTTAIDGSGFLSYKFDEQVALEIGFHSILLSFHDWERRQKGH